MPARRSVKQGLELLATEFQKWDYSPIYETFAHHTPPLIGRSVRKVTVC